MKTKLLYLLLLMPMVFFAQQRDVLKGRVISDVLKVEYVSVYNLSSKASVATDADGRFEIHARLGDTLKVTAIAFKDEVVVVKQSDINDGLIVIRVEGSITMLDEVLVNNLTGNLALDSKNAKIVKTDEAKFDTYEINKDLYINSIAGNGRGMDFMAIGRMMGGPPKRKTPPAQTFITSKVFASAVRELYSDEYFVKSLKIKKEDIPSFLSYCDQGEAVRILLDPKNEFKLIAYLTDKSVEYLKNKE
jgi:hypothetical protein